MAGTVLRPGDAFDGYEIREVIGIGGMAIVYRAEQMSLGRDVALKVLGPAIADDDAFRDRFRHECRLIAAINHPNVVTVHDFGEVDGRLFLAMQLVQGETLAERLRAGGLTAEDAVRLLAQIGNALDAAHAAGLVHRDVKPQNILIGAHGHPYLADFGIAKGATTAGMTATTGFVGTCNYAAPEQVSAGPITPAVDVYALAAILYQCLTGRPPFARESDAAILHAHVYEPPPTFPPAAPGSEAANRLIARGMAKQPSERFVSAGELMREAERVVAALPAARRRIAPAFPDPSSGTSDGAQTTDTASTAAATSSPTGDASSAPTRSSATKPGRPAHPRRWVMGAVATILAAGAVVAGIGLGGSGARPLHFSASGNPFTVKYAWPWRKSRADVAGAFALAESRSAIASASATGTGRGAIQLISNGATLAAGRLETSSPVPGGIPPALRHHYGAHFALGMALIAGHPARRYTWTSRTRSLVAYVVPLSSGDGAVICQAGAAKRAALRSCERLAQRISVPRSDIIRPGPDVALAQAISASLAGVRAARSSLHGLAETTLGARAPGAANLSQAESRAARSLGHLLLPRRYQPVVANLSTALNRDAGAFSALATAGHSDNRRAYSAAVKQVSAASGALASRLRAFAAYDLDVPGLPALRLVGLPAASIIHDGPGRPHKRPHPIAEVRPKTSTKAAAPTTSTTRNTSTTHNPSMTVKTVTTHNPSMTVKTVTTHNPSMTVKTVTTHTSSITVKTVTTHNTPTTGSTSTTTAPSMTGTTSTTGSASTTPSKSATGTTSTTVNTSTTGAKPMRLLNPSGADYVFWRGARGGLWEMWYSGTGWNQPSQPLPQVTGLQSAPAVTVHADGEQDVFWQSTDGHLLETWYTGTWNPPRDRAEQVGSAPSAGVDAAGDEYVFWQGTDGELREMEYTDEQWSQPSTLNSGPMSSPPAVAVRANGQTDVFWKGGNGQLWEMSYTNRWNPAAGRGGGPLGSGPCVGVDAAGNEYVFWQGTDGGLWEMTNIGGHWSGQVRVKAAGVLGSAPSVAVHPNGERDVFWSGTDGRLWEMWYTDRWNGPHPIGGQLGSPPAAGTDAPGK